MKEISNIMNHSDMFDAEGRVTINYIDPLTNRITEEIKGNNYVFKEVLFGKNWNTLLTTCTLMITDGTQAIETDYPLMKGKLLGYGEQTLGSLGNYRGAWDAGNSWSALRTPTGFSNKYTYQFTPTQALGTLGQIGLSCGQFQGLTSVTGSTPYKHADAFMHASGDRVGGQCFTETDSYSTTTTGGRIVQKYVGLFLGTESSSPVNHFDASAVVSTTSLQYFRVTRDNVTGKFYLVAMRIPPTATQFEIYEYSNESFTTLLNTYTIPFSAVNAALTTDITNATNASNFVCCSVYNGRMLFNYVTDNTFASVRLSDGNTVLIPKVSLVDATNFGVTWTHYAGSGGTNANAASQGSYAKGKYFYFYWGLANNQHGCVVDMDAMQVVSYCKFNTSSSSAFLTKHPVYDFTQSHVWSGSGSFSIQGTSYNNIAIYKVPAGAPTRPAGYGMTITYELEILY